MNSYELLRTFWDFAFENPEKIKPNHCALYCFCVEHCNRLGWKKKFGLPTTMAKDAIGIRSYNTYIQTLEDLVEWGFLTMIEKSKNQYSSNIVALSKFNKALDKALDKAFIKHGIKHNESTTQSIGTVNKPINNITNLPINKLTNNKIPSLTEFLNYYFDELQRDFPSLDFSVQAKYESWLENDWRDGNNTPIKNWKTKLKNTIPFLKPITNNQIHGITENKSTRDMHAISEFGKDFENVSLYPDKEPQ